MKDGCQELFLLGPQRSRSKIKNQFPIKPQKGNIADAFQNRWLVVRSDIHLSAITETFGMIVASRSRTRFAPCSHERILIFFEFCHERQHRGFLMFSVVLSFLYLIPTRRSSDKLDIHSQQDLKALQYKPRQNLPDTHESL